MKKVLALLLAIALVLSLAACGGGSSSGNTSENTTTEATETVYSIGDTAKTDVAEVAVTKVEFADSYNDCYPDDGYQFACVTFTFKNIGKNTIPRIDKPTDGWTKVLCSIPFVDYNNGYCFYVGDVKTKNHNYMDSLFQSNQTLVDSLAPLSNAVNCTSAIYVPNEVATNTSAPLLIKVMVPKSEGTEIISYKVR